MVVAVVVVIVAAAAVILPAVKLIDIDRRIGKAHSARRV